METRLVCFLIKMAVNKKASVLDFVKRFVPVFYLQYLENYREKLNVSVYLLKVFILDFLEVLLR